MRGRSAVVLCGPVPPSRAVLPLIDRDALVVAADGAIAHAEDLGLVTGWLVGDLDSVTPEALARAVATGVEVIGYPPDKDETDLELALSLVRDIGARDVVVVDGGVGPRVDHFLANVLVVASPRWLPTRVRAVVGDALITVIHPSSTPTTLDPSFGTVVTLLAVSGQANGLRTQGMRWSLCDEPLEANVGRGVSNTIVADRASVTIRDGVVIAIQPGAIR